MTKKQQGFTLIEIMIVVAILGILAAFALPAYQNYMIRAQVSEGLALSAGAQVAVSEYYMERGMWPDTNKMAAVAEKRDIEGAYTKHVKVDENVIQITYRGNAHPAIANARVDLVATENDGSVSWACAGSKTIKAKHLPRVCR